MSCGNSWPRPAKPTVGVLIRRGAARSILAPLGTKDLLSRGSGRKSCAMSDSDLPFEAPRRLRAWVRAREISILVLAAAVGALAGLGVVVMGMAVNLLHSLF